MKTLFKKLAAVLMCIALVITMVACSRTTASSTSSTSGEKQEQQEVKTNSTETSASTTATTETSVASTEEPDTQNYPEGPNGAPDDDYTCYMELLGQYFYALSGPTDTYPDYNEPGYSWLWDFKYTVDSTGKNALELVGFSAHDYSGDGKLDLIIGVYPVNSEWDPGTEIEAIYTRDENDEYHLAVEGWGRNRQYMLDTGEFYNEGSSGASESCFGTYKLTKDGTGIEWIDFYFSTYNAVTGNIEYYHNTTGIWDVSASEKANVKDADEFWDLQESYQKRIVNMDLKPFYSLQGAIGYMGGALIWPMFASNYSYDLTALREFDVTTDNYPTELVLEAYDDVYDVTLCTIEWGEDRGGEQDFTLVPLTKVGDIAYGNAVFVKASITAGDTSTLYYIFKDRNGTEHCYFVSMSGADSDMDYGVFY